MRMMFNERFIVREGKTKRRIERVGAERNSRCLSGKSCCPRPRASFSILNRRGTRAPAHPGGILAQAPCLLLQRLSD